MIPQYNNIKIISHDRIIINQNNITWKNQSRRNDKSYEINKSDTNQDYLIIQIFGIHDIMKLINQSHRNDKTYI